MKETKARLPRPEEINAEFKRADIGLVDLSVSIENQIGWASECPTFHGRVVRWKVKVIAFDNKLRSPPLPAVNRYGIAWALRSIMYLASTEAIRHPIHLPGGMEGYIQDVKITRSTKNPGMTEGEFLILIPQIEDELIPSLDSLTFDVPALLPPDLMPTKKPMKRRDAFWWEEE